MHHLTLHQATCCRWARSTIKPAKFKARAQGQIHKKIKKIINGEVLLHVTKPRITLQKWQGPPREKALDDIMAHKNASLHQSTQVLMQPQQMRKLIDK